MKESPLRANIYIVFLFVVIAASIAVLLYGDARIILAVSVVYLSYDVSVSLLFFTATAVGVRKLRRLNANRQIAPAPGKRFVSVVIAAYNEIVCIEDTIQSLIAQRGVSQQIIIASDGSDDGMNERLISRFDLQARGENQISWANSFQSADGVAIELELLTLPRGGKGAALNAGLAAVKSEITVTLDADTRLEPDAILEMARAFDTQKTAATGGFIYVRDPAESSWIVFYQYVEFLRNFMWRIGLTNANVCLQVSGAFGAFRTQILREIGGFAVDSLTEDYEIIYRLHEFLQENRRDDQITITTSAVAYTDSPKTARAFVIQRTRWFTGFLQTLWQYRRMIFSARFGRIGLVMLPIKTVDALLPIWGFASLLILLLTIAFGRGVYPLWALSIFAGKWLFDVFVISLMLRWYGKLFPNRKFALSTAQIAFCLFTEGLIFQPFRQFAVLNAYGWSVRRVKSLEKNRWLTNRQPLPTLPSAALIPEESDH